MSLTKISAFERLFDSSVAVFLVVIGVVVAGATTYVSF